MSKRVELARVLGLWDATAVVIGAIVGVGIFFSPSDVARVAGSTTGAMLAWIVGGVIALLGAFTFAELGRLRPLAGGQYHILRDAFGRAPAFLFVFCNLTAVQAGGVAIIALLCAMNLGVALHGETPGGPWVVAVATALTWILVAANVVGVRAGAGLQNATVVLKLVALAGLDVVAALVDAPAAASAVEAGAAPAPLTFAALFAAVTLSLFAYGGWQQGLWMAGEVVDAPRVLPRAIVLGVLVVLATYLAANWAYLDLLGFAGVSGSKALAADAYGAAWPGAARRIAAAAVFVSAFGVLNAQFLTGPRLTWAMAREGQFFAPFATLHPRFATPAAATLLLGGIGTALLVGLGLDRTDVLTTGVVVVDAVFFALTGLALPILRSRLPRAERGARWLAAAAIAFAALEAAAITGSLLQRDMRPVALTGVAWIVGGLVVWGVWFRKRA